MTTLSSSCKQNLDEFIDAALKTKKTPGFILGVTNVDGEIYFHGGGPKVVNDDASGEINQDSVFWLCSQTKLIASLAGLILIEQGKISMDTPVADYFPQLRNPVIVDSTSPQTTFRPATAVMTVKHLLNFSSGLFYGDRPDSDGSLPPPYTSKEMHAAEDPYSAWFQTLKGDLPGVPLKFEPGTDFVYGWSADVLGFLVEKVTGQTLEEFLQEHIFKPLGMETSFYLTPNLRERLVDLACRAKDGSLSPWAGQLKIIEQDPARVQLHLGGVGLYGSVRDYLKLLRHLMQLKVENPILRRETVAEMFVPALPEAGEKAISAFLAAPNWGPGAQWGTATGLTTQDWPNRRKKGSAFWGGWAGTEYFIDPTSGIAAVLGIQVSPFGDQELWNLWPKLEASLYSALVI
ncbi:beta-lactamase [Gymnopilus junonius]|uniref:Beta-lactamase n=1 Tax=Gymnopilus junonius TaxID=109634 RepID=A0A9P5TRY9_GYMJU|nr:beta-lactamase [Gymnopilus junonius]